MQDVQDCHLESPWPPKTGAQAGIAAQLVLPSAQSGAAARPVRVRSARDSRADVMLIEYAVVMRLHQRYHEALGPNIRTSSMHSATPDRNAHKARCAGHSKQTTAK